MRTLHAQRYLTDRARQFELDVFVRGILPGLDMSETLKFYADFDQWSKDPQDAAFLSANDRFYLFTQVLGRKDGIHPWLFDRFREVEANPDGYLDLWARYHYKSSTVTFAGIIQEVIRDPEITCCIFSYTKPIAVKFLSQIKNEIERNQLLRTICPDVFWVEPRKQSPQWALDGGLTMIRTSNPKEATIEAWGLDAQPTSKHFKLLVYDDVVVKKSVTNSAQVEKTTENWELSDNLGIGDKTRKWMVGTRYDLADTYAEIIERGIVKVRLHPATHNGRLDGIPVFLTEAHWAQIKKTQRKTVASQMLQNPAAGGEQMFEMQWLMSYEVRPARLNVYIMVDPASSMKKESDRTAMAVVGIDERGNKYFLDGCCHRMTELDRWNNLTGLYIKWANMPGVDSVEVGYERYGAQSDVSWMKQRMLEPNARAVFDIRELNWSRSSEQSKVDRVRRLQPDIMGSEYKFYFPAIIWRPNKGHDAAGGMCFWSYDINRNDFVWTPAEKIKVIGKTPEGGDRYHWTGEMKLTSAMQAMHSMGEPHRCAKPIVRKDEEGKLYDVTWRLIEELRVFPKRRGHDDLADATSRVYDMEFTLPVRASEQAKINNNQPSY